MLVDDAGDPALRTTGMLAEQLIEHDLIGRGVACHARAVGTYDETSILRLAGLARRAGMGFISDPHTGPLHLPVDAFVEEGLDVGLGQDDIEDAYYPWGRHNMLEVAFLSGHILGFRSNERQRLLV
jgi:cytosine deaminase